MPDCLSALQKGANLSVDLPKKPQLGNRNPKWLKRGENSGDATRDMPTPRFLQINGDEILLPIPCI